MSSGGCELRFNGGRPQGEYMYPDDANLFTSDTSSGRELPIEKIKAELAALKQTYRAECDRQDAQFAEIERLMTENAGLREITDTMHRALDAILLMVPGNSAAWVVASNALVGERVPDARIAALEAENAALRFDLRGRDHDIAKLIKERDDFRDGGSAAYAERDAKT